MHTEKSVNISHRDNNGVLTAGQRDKKNIVIGPKACGANVLWENEAADLLTQIIGLLAVHRKIKGGTAKVVAF